MIYSNTLESFSMRSSWRCMSVQDASNMWVWKIVEGPTSDGARLTFTVDLPADAVISRAWLSMEVGSPLSGAAYRTMNGRGIPSGGVMELEGINAETTAFEAIFAFKANGAIYQTTSTHYSIQEIGNPTLNIEYTAQSEEEEAPDENAPGQIIRKETSGNQLPRLLHDDLSEKARLAAVKLSLDLQMHPLSTAVIDIPCGQAEVMVRDFLELFDPNGSVGIFRAVKTETNAGYSQRAWLKHAFCTLADDIAVGVQTMEGSFREVVASILEAQSVKRWALGDVELPDEYKVLYSHSYDTLQQAILDIYQRLPEGYVLELDTLRVPWLMHLRKLREDDWCECRMNRNVQGAKVTIDSANQCTRVYPYGAGEGEDRINLSTLTGALFMDAETSWGTIARTFTEEDIFDALTLQDVAALYLEKHKDPLVSVSVDGVSIYNLTGEPLDRFYTGRLCRLALPELGMVMNERVISISYPDVYGKPDKATLTLANKVRNAATSIADLMREATNSKLIGGVVDTEEVKNSASGITSASPGGAHFDVSGYGNLLSARVSYKCNPSGSSAQVRCNVSVDGTLIPNSSDMAQPVDIFPYLERDENGIPLQGEHYVMLSPVAASGVSHWLHTTVVLKTIEKK